MHEQEEIQFAIDSGFNVGFEESKRRILEILKDNQCEVYHKYDNGVDEYIHADVIKSIEELKYEI